MSAVEESSGGRGKMDCNIPSIPLVMRDGVSECVSEWTKKCVCVCVCVCVSVCVSV